MDKDPDLKLVETKDLLNELQKRYPAYILSYVSREGNSHTIIHDDGKTYGGSFVLRGLLGEMKGHVNYYLETHKTHSPDTDLIGDDPEDLEDDA